ncbi:MAG: carboxypeptidase regulatory-like domain-containing protein [Bryobacterales bacterium]|nr:carboxypeptidase regulatory-like domain-containing protein [Bryobacterales bacterium]
MQYRTLVGSVLRVALLGAALFGNALWAQSGSILGTVTDPQGAAVPNAKVQALDESKQIVARETTSDEAGRFALRPLLPGRYTVKVEASGFRPLDRTALTLDQNQIMELGSVGLTLGQTTEAVTVEAVVPLVETSTAQKSYVVDGKQVTQLALNGRDFQSLIRTLPGIVSNDRSDFRLAFNNTDAFNVNGLRGSMNNVYLDGSINTDVGANDGQYTQISLDAVGEFKVQTSTFNAEYGRNPGVMISINTKSGGRQFHGTLYEFLRNNALDARFPFDTTGTTQKLRFNQFGGNLSGPIPLPGVSSFKEPKLFFFFNYEGTRATRPLGGTFLDIPSGAMLGGDLSGLYRPGFILDGNNQPTQFRNGQVFRPGTVVRGPGGRIIGGDPYLNNVIPRAEWSRNAPAFLKLLALPDRNTATPTPNLPEQVRYPFQNSYGFRKNAEVLRVDYAISPKANFFFRWADDSQRETNLQGIFGTTPYPIAPQFRAKPGSSWSWNLVNVISPTTTNEFIFTYNHLTQIVDIIEETDKAAYDRDALGFTFRELYPDSNIRNKFPRFNCGVGSCNFSQFSSNWLSEGKTFAITDNFTKNAGAHTFKFGGLWNRNDNGQQPAWTDALNINFGPSTENPGDTGNTFANMLVGNYTSISQSNGRFYGTFRFYGLELYAQDTWKVNRKLTVEMGLRWHYYGPTFTYGKYLQNYFDPARYKTSEAAVLDLRAGLRQGSIIGGNPFNGLVEEGNGIPKGFSRHRYNNWGPRLGIAYDPFGDGKTSIRMGGGIFYERIRQNVNNFDGLGNPPLVYNPTLYGANIDQVTPALIAGGTRFPVGLSTFDEAGQIPTIYSWSIGVQRELGRQNALDISYVGNMGRYLQYRRDLNQLPLGTTTRPGALTAVNGVTNALRPYQGFTSVNFTEYGSVSNYNGLQARFTRRFARALTANASYAWSKAMSEIDGDGTGLGYFMDRRREYGPAGFDRTHTLTIDYVYELPQFAKSNGFAKAVVNGWQLNGITRFATGNPATITSNANPGTLGGGVRADYIGGEIEPAQRDRFNYFNIFAFARPQEGTLGNLGKNTLRLAGINQWDISMFKNTKITERVNLQLRIETFNTFNHTQWGAVNTAINAPNPGQPLTQATRGAAGQVTDTRDPRTLQLGVKLLF